MDESSSEALEQNIFPNYPEKYQVKLSELRETTRKIISQVEKIKETLHPVYWQKEGFDLDRALEEIPGPVVEVAGPTSRTPMIDFKKLKTPFFVSNINPGVKITDPYTGEFIEYMGKVDFQADATRLPFESETIGALFAACLPIEIRDEFLEEASRVLKPNGLVVFEGLFPKDLEEARKKGFEIVVSQTIYNPEGKSKIKAVFQKIQTSK